MYYIGIDGSGTYSRLVAIDKEMKIIGRHAGNSVNLIATSHTGVKENLRKLLNEFNKLTNTTLDECSGLCIGGPNHSTKEQMAITEDIFYEIGANFPVRAVTEAELILAAETKGEPGVAIISGISSIGICLDRQGNIVRCGGLGHIIGDIGSAYWIGIQSIRYALMAADGRRPKTILTDKIKDHFKLKEITDILSLVYNKNFQRSQIADLALVVKYAAINEDEAAMEIESEAANELYIMAKTLLNHGRFTEHKVILSGSVITAEGNIRQRFISLLKSDFKGAEIKPLKEKPEIGAAYLATGIKK